MPRKLPSEKIRIAIICPRIDKIDGVSLEILKWFWVLTEQGHEVEFIIGGINHVVEDFVYRDNPLIHPLFYRSFSNASVIPELQLNNRTVKHIRKEIFVNEKLSRDAMLRVGKFSRRIRKKIENSLKEKEIDLIIAQNYSLPTNLPASIAVAEIAEQGNIPVIYHNHDFWWERKVYSGKCDALLRKVCPFVSKNTRQVAINSKQYRRLRRENSNLVHQFSKRGKKLVFTVPNVFDDVWVSRKPRAYVEDLKQMMGLKSNDIVFLSPVRILRRKNLEAAVDLLAGFGSRSKLLVTGYTEEKVDTEYARELKKYAREKGVSKRIRFIGRRIGLMSRVHPRFMKYSFLEAYLMADFVVYPSAYEGWGNALIEAIFFGKPVLANRYPVYLSDIKKNGFSLVEISNGKITPRTVKQVKSLIPKLYSGEGAKDVQRKVRRITKSNLSIARKKLSADVLDKKLKKIIRSI